MTQSTLQSGRRTLLDVIRFACVIGPFILADTPLLSQIPNLSQPSRDRPRRTPLSLPNQMIMSGFSKLKRPWLWLGATALAWAVGLASTALGMGTVFLWQAALHPPEQVGMYELLAQQSLGYWLLHWGLLGFWLCLYWVGLFVGCFTGPKFYNWMVNRYDLLRWRDSTRS
jgi:hypothetical protein